MEHALNIPLYLNYGFDLARDAKFSIYGGSNEVQLNVIAKGILGL